MFIPVRIISASIFLFACLTIGQAQAPQQSPPNLPAKFALPANPIELARAARPNVYFDAVGRKSAIFGHESGVFESWVFPMKLFHDARVTVDGKTVKFTQAFYGANSACQFDAVLKRKTTIEIAFKEGIEFDAPTPATQLGERTTSLKVLEVSSPATNRLSVRLEGLAGRTYLLRFRGGMSFTPTQGGTLKGEDGAWKLIEVIFPASGNNDAYQTRQLELTLKESGKRK